MYGTLWYGVVLRYLWYGMVGCDIVYGVVWYGTVCYGVFSTVHGMVGCGIWYSIIWYDMVWYGMVGYGKVNGTIWYDIAWHGNSAFSDFWSRFFLFKLKKACSRNKHELCLKKMMENLWLLSFFFHKGEILGITRFGLAKMKESVLMLASVSSQHLLLRHLKSLKI